MDGVAAPGPRRLLLVTGEPRWCEDWVMARLADHAVDPSADAVLWVARQAPPAIPAVPAGRFAQHLGGECRLLVFNAHQGLHPDAFAALIGTLRGGGDCVLLAPPLDRWAGFADPDKARFAAYPRPLDAMHGHFLGRLARRWSGHAAVRMVTPETANETRLRLAPEPRPELILTDEQQLAVEAVERVAHGHARRPLVISADRGRGKSTLLGVAAARLLLAGLPRITVTGPHRAALTTLFRQAAATADLPDQGVADIRIGAGELRFRLPAECLDDADPGLLLVDEAAAIPVAVLGRLLGRSNRLVFASTLHGYEGSGRGFGLRFGAVLDREMPQWRALRLTTPVRWAEHDPLERLVEEGLMLDAELGEVPPGGALKIDEIAPEALAADEDLLRAALGLLVNAHYQTRPSDMRQLLDNPDARLWLARRRGVVVGVLLTVHEGGLDPAIRGAVLSGARRPRGHLLPQSLAVHAGLVDCLGQRVLRIQRIAVHPQLQRGGIGSALLQALAAQAVEEDFDLLGCAFGVEPPLLAFWRAAGFVPVRLGIRVDPASAAHSLFMLRGTSARGERLTQAGERRFLGDLPWALGGSLRALDSLLAVLLLEGRDCRDLPLDDVDRQALAAIADGARQPATAEAVVWKALVRIAARADVPAGRLAPLVAGWLQHQPDTQLCRAFALCGRRELDGRLRDLLRGQSNTLAADG